MKSRAKVLKLENISGTSSKTNNDYNLDFLHFLDLDNYDKVKVMVPKDQVAILGGCIGKDGVVELGVDPKTEKLQFASFKMTA